MRVVVVSSETLSRAKATVIDGLGERLSGIAAVPVVPHQVGFWRHASSLAAYSGRWGWPKLALGALAGRAARTLGPILQSKRMWNLEQIAHRASIPFMRARNASDPALAKWLSNLGTDLVVSMQSHWVPETHLAIPRYGWLNLHHGRLPDYRGVFSVFWAMLNGEPTLSVTAHIMGRQFDRGPIVVERPVVVEAGATVETMENRMWSVSPEVMLEAVHRIESGQVLSSGTTQERGRYFSYPTRQDLRKASSAGLRLR